MIFTYIGILVINLTHNWPVLLFQLREQIDIVQAYLLGQSLQRMQRSLAIVHNVLVILFVRPSLSALVRTLVSPFILLAFCPSVLPSSVRLYVGGFVYPSVYSSVCPFFGPSQGWHITFS